MLKEKNDKSKAAVPEVFASRFSPFA